MMQKYKILWADDEIELLRPHAMLLEQKGYAVTCVNNATEAIDLGSKQHFDVVLLDEHMPGMSGLEALPIIKRARPTLPVIMITKNEEERIMEEAIGSKIDDYLIKPVNPNQILLALKKILDKRRLEGEYTTATYREEFNRITMALQGNPNHAEWADLYRRLVHWEMSMEVAGDDAMKEVLASQRTEANAEFWKFIRRHYEGWLNDPKADRPVLSHQLMRRKVFPLAGKGEPVFLFLIDNLRFDQWKAIEPVLSEFFNVEEESVYYSILPTATAYARNAIFSGLLPSEMERRHPGLWVGEDEDEGKNRYEEEFLKEQLVREKLNFRTSYNKIRHFDEGKKLADNFNNLWANDLNVIVVNFVDMLSHARSDMAMIRELAPDEAAYRSITRSWLEHSTLLEMLKQASARKARIIITTDHGTMRVRHPFRIKGQRDINANLRYKHGQTLGFEGDRLVHITKPERYFLPKLQVNTHYVFAVEDHFFVYPNNYNQFVGMYQDTFQHGGISLEEMIIPVVTLSSRNA